MVASIVIGAAIFGYAGWTLTSYIRKTKKGKCASCSLAKSCVTACNEVASSSSK
ncbi:FeoB-associated Cys-rich membrane protein [Paenibacillus zeisoli]|uniref:FeoB-associated Cys-rich membrane protein n=1 Tax=Paenibacillus zeisoli TaxID=2496267 RepID=A0A3S1D0V2_9BACL|nr:FeoB-associated Cys-rich membrane protein [Paenibacillus zeisoli]RUT33545.1 FeoB-associated Cys-rich membrane protein [Paenibacillus zeisoli]